MIFDNYEIKLTKYVWAHGIELKDVNIFSSVAPQSITIVDLAGIPGVQSPYLIDISSIDWSFDNTNDRGNVPLMYFETSDVTYTLSGRKNNKFMVDFLGIFRDTTYEKYVIEIKDKATGVYINSGIASQEYIKQSYKNDPTSERIECVCGGFDKEFKEYYQSVPLPQYGHPITFGFNFVPFHNRDGGDYYPRKYMPLIDLLQVLFDPTHAGIVQWELEPDVAGWCIISNPFLGQLMTGEMKFIKSSYDRIAASGENCIGWLDCLCNSMGWVWYHYDRKFYIKNRVSLGTGATVTLDVKKIKSPLDFSKSQAVIQFNNVVVIDGVEMSGNSDGTGTIEDLARLKIFTTRQTEENNNPFDGIGSGGGGFGFQLTTSINLKWQRFSGENNYTWNYWIMKLQFIGISTIPVKIADITIDKKDTLQLNTGGTGNNGWAYNNSGALQHHAGHYIGPGGNYPFDMSTTPAANDFCFTGNYGSAMFRFIDINHVTTYDEYVKTDKWKQNFSKFFNMSLDRKATFPYKDKITNPLDTYNFINDDAGKFEGNWSTVSLKFDPKINEATLELQQQRES